MHMLQNYPVMEVDTKVGFFFKSQQQKFTIAKIPGFHAHLQLFSVAYHDNLKYHLYAGTVAAIVGNYAMAIELLEAVGAALPCARTWLTGYYACNRLSQHPLMQTPAR